MSRLNKFVLLRLHSSFHAASPHWHTVQPSQSFCLANVLRWLLIGQNDLWHTISSSSWPLCVTLLMATLKTEATLTTSHLMVLVLINVTRAKNDSEVNGNLKQLLRIHTHTHTRAACMQRCTQTHFSILSLSWYHLSGDFKESMKNRSECPGKPQLTCLYGGSLGTLMDGPLPTPGSPKKISWYY